MSDIAEETTVEPPSILIVEDEAIVALDLKMELEALGYAVAGIADSAARALELAERLQPSLALMDIVLKGDTDGIHAAAALRRLTDLPVIFLTSFSDAETVRRAAHTAAYGYLTKPFQAKELRAGIEVALWKSRIERQLRQADRWFALTLRCVQDAVIVVDPEGRVRFMNLAAERLLHCTGNDAVGQPVEAWVRFEHALDDARALVMSALDQGRVVGVRHARLLTNRPGAAPIPVDESAGPIHDEQGRRLGAVLVLRDVSERLRQEALLRSSDERFRNAFEFAPLGMALVALDGRHLQVNGALCRLLERTPAALLACSQSELAVPEDVAHEQARLLELHAESAAVTQFEKRFLRPDGAEPVCTLIHASLLRHDDEPTCYLYQVHDLSAQKAAAVRLAELAAERIRREASELADRSKSEFLSRVSHEMRTPLNAVLGFAQLLQLEEARGRVAASGYPEHILQAGTHLLALVDDVLDLQRAADGALRLRMGPVGLDEALPAAVALLGPMAEARQVRLELALAPRLSVQADPTRLRQIVLNLGSNAIKYNVHGGSVRFTADEAPSGRIRLAVEDTGIGMSETQREHLFEPFNRLGREGSKVEGVGLGLVITRKLVEQMGASLQMSSHPETGTRVVLEFARAEEGA